MDTERQQLYAADAMDGALYRISLSDLTITKVVDSLGEPSALYFDSERRTLYIADAAKGCIWILKVDAPTRSVSVFGFKGNLYEPVGLTVGSDHTMWIADRRTNVIYSTSRDGTVASRLPR